MPPGKSRATRHVALITAPSAKKTLNPVTAAGRALWLSGDVG
jgi:hypothetical protein